MASRLAVACGLFLHWQALAVQVEMGALDVDSDQDAEGHDDEFPSWITDYLPTAANGKKGVKKFGKKKSMKHQLKQAAIDQIFIINLRNRVGKWSYATEELCSLGVSCKRWAAVQVRPGIEETTGLYGEIARNPDPRIEDKKGDRYYYSTLSSYLSHLSVLRHINEHGHKGRNYLVFEDDVAMKHGLTIAEINLIMDWVAAPAGGSKQWDAIRLDCKSERENTPFPAMLRTNHRITDEGSWASGGTHAVIYRYEGAQRFLKYLEKHPWAPLDSMFFTDHLNTFCVNHGLFKYQHDRMLVDVPP